MKIFLLLMINNNSFYIVIHPEIAEKNYIPIKIKFNNKVQLINDTLDSNIMYNHYFDKEFIGPLQNRTGGQKRLDFDITKDFSYSSLNGHLMFSVLNLLDVVGRSHLESKKDTVQLPGRSFNFMLKLFY